MVKKPNISGGGANTNLNGLKFERDKSLLQLLQSQSNYQVINNEIKEQNKTVALYYSKHGLYKEFLKGKNIKWKIYLSAQLLPDQALYGSIPFLH